jgi:hypothetical protein
MQVRTPDALTPFEDTAIRTASTAEAVRRHDSKLCINRSLAALDIPVPSP